MSLMYTVQYSTVQLALTKPSTYNKYSEKWDMYNSVYNLPQPWLCQVIRCWWFTSYDVIV